VPRFFFDFRTSQGVTELDATGLRVPDVAAALYGCMGAVLDIIDENAIDVERLSVRAENGDLLLFIDLQALRAVSIQNGHD
jgi:hypothetical protein